MRKFLISLVLLALVAVMSSKIETNTSGEALVEQQKPIQIKPQEQKKDDDKKDEKDDHEEKEEKKIVTAQLTVDGRASATVFAGVIRIGIEFTTVGSCAVEALNENTAKVKNALKHLRKFGCNEESIYTVFFAITPHYKECEGKPTTEIEGYIVTQTIEVVVVSKKLAAKIIDTTGGCGGILLWVTFDISAKADRIVRAKLIKQAVDDAVFKARKVAKRLGFRLQAVKAVVLNDSLPLEVQKFTTFAGATLVGINKTLSLSVNIQFEMIKEVKCHPMKKD